MSDKNIDHIALTTNEINTFLERIHIQRKANDLFFLKEIIAGILTHIPFHNFFLLTAKGQKPSIKKIIYYMLGGYGGLCEVRNPFLYIFLRTLGFEVEFLASTMKSKECHITLLVIIESQKYWVDIGNGFPYFYPIPLGNTKEYSHPFMKYRIMEANNRYELQHQVRYSDGWKTNHSFCSFPVPFAKFDNMIDRHYSQSDWGPFYKAVRMNHWTQEKGYIIRDNLFLEVSSPGNFKKKYLNTFEDLKKILIHYFSIQNFSKVLNLEEVWSIWKERINESPNQ